ncbi:MAG: WGR domain-containing protein [Verrucomicrobiota bacterium]
MSPASIDRIQSASLYLRDGSSDKEYHAAIEPKACGFIVTFAYGRRGNTLTVGTKTEAPVSLADATKVFDKLVASKVAKGYRALGGSFTPSQLTGNEGNDSGVRCQLLNPVDSTELERLLTGASHCLEEKHDGYRLLVRKRGDEITGINRRGVVVAIPEPIRRAVAEIGFDVLLDGVALGDTLRAFDLLEVKGRDFRQRRYLDRHSGLIMTIPPSQPALRRVSSAVDPNDKVEIFEELRQTGCKGVVFKDVNAPFSPGRPASGGPQLTYGFIVSASFVAADQTARRCVALGLYDDESLVPAGSVAIPPGQPIPGIGEVVEVRYRFAVRESGCIHEPVYVGKRPGIPAAECGIHQLKYRSINECRG